MDVLLDKQDAGEAGHVVVNVSGVGKAAVIDSSQPESHVVLAGITLWVFGWPGKQSVLNLTCRAAPSGTRSKIPLEIINGGYLGL